MWPSNVTQMKWVFVVHVGWDILIAVFHCAEIYLYDISTRISKYATFNGTDFINKKAISLNSFEDIKFEALLKW